MSADLDDAKALLEEGLESLDLEIAEYDDEPNVVIVERSGFVRDSAQNPSVTLVLAYETLGTLLLPVARTLSINLIPDAGPAFIPISAELKNRWGEDLAHIAARKGDAPPPIVVDPVLAWALTTHLRDHVLTGVNEAIGQHVGEIDPERGICAMIDIQQQDGSFSVNGTLYATPGICWNGSAPLRDGTPCDVVEIDLNSIAIPETLIANLTGRPLTSVYDHPALAGLVICGMARDEDANLLRLHVDRVRTRLCDIVPMDRLVAVRDETGEIGVTLAESQGSTSSHGEARKATARRPSLKGRRP